MAKEQKRTKRSAFQHIQGFTREKSRYHFEKRGDMATFTTNLGKRLRELRTKARLSQDQLAEQAGISAKYLGEVERGAVNVSVLILHKLSAVLGVGLADFFESGHLSPREELVDHLVSMLNEASDQELQQVYRVLHALLR